MQYTIISEKLDEAELPGTQPQKPAAVAHVEQLVSNCWVECICVMTKQKNIPS